MNKQTEMKKTVPVKAAREYSELSPAEKAKKSYVDQLIAYKEIDWRKLTIDQLKRITEEVRNPPNAQ
ncbi:hypothetical protein [Granulicella sp. dw_53]|uniref:hypothetical protein n=1 Tax=Granulicella sp. dw_53 TaxID=2719792 RepID=UPI001BD6158F|nr:hypothetical protein [Granulicella sp. dw_53]